jgi:hypothetical protein
MKPTLMQSKQPPNEVNSGNKPSKERPWCWCEKGALEMITETFSDQAASARSVYLALCQLRSDERSDSFKASKALIAHMAGVSYSTAANILKRFESLKLIHVKRNTVTGTKGHAPSTYTLGNGYLTPSVMVTDMLKEKEKKVRTTSSVNGEHSTENTVREGTTHNMQTTVKEFSVFEGEKEEAIHGGNGSFQDNSGIVKGFFLGGKFFTTEQAQRVGVAKPELIEQFIPYTRRRAAKIWSYN